MSHETPFHGSCLCGGVGFTAVGPLRPVVVCHCSQCRRTSGHAWAATSAPKARFLLTKDATLRWFHASTAARRGFCQQCGASLFWEPADEPRIAIAAGAFDGPTGLAIAAHIFTEDAGSYYRHQGPPPPETAGVSVLECRCQCGRSAFRLPGPSGPVTSCHCRQCRKLSGHYSASFDAPEEAVEWQRRDRVAEYVTPGGAARGFCRDCGSSLYFRAADGAFSVEAGCVSGATGGTLAGHIHTASKGDYYDLDDGLPQG